MPGRAAASAAVMRPVVRAHPAPALITQQARGLQAWAHSLWRPVAAAAGEAEAGYGGGDGSGKAAADGEGGGEGAEPAEEELGFERTAIVELADDVFGAEPRLDLLHRVVVWQRREWWQGTASAKGRSEVRGGGKKPWRQKGTGRARASTIRSPLWRGGGVTHGPKPRDHSIKIPNKVHRMALRVALSVKYAQGDLVVVDDLDIPTHRSKLIVQVLDDAGLTLPTLFVDVETPPDNFLLATRNVPNCDAIACDDISVYAMLHRHKLVLTRAAIAQLETRLTTAKPGVTAVNAPQEEAAAASL